MGDQKIVTLDENSDQSLKPNPYSQNELNMIIHGQFFIIIDKRSTVIHFGFGNLFTK